MTAGSVELVAADEKFPDACSRISLDHHIRDVSIFSTMRLWVHSATISRIDKISCRNMPQTRGNALLPATSGGAATLV